jgi:YidC/Oxa1 family membrane protein insertase
MDRQSLIGLTLIFMIVLAWAIFFPPAPPEPAAATAGLDSTTIRIDTSRASAAAQASAAVQPVPAKPSTPGDSAAQRTERLGSFASVGSGAERSLRVKTDKLDLTLSTKGGRILGANLVEFKTHDSLPQPIVPDGAGTRLSAQFRHGSRIIDTGELYFTPSSAEPITLTGTQTQTLTLRADVAPGKAVEQIYTFTAGKYEVGYSLRLIGLGELITNNNLELQAAIDVPHTEQNLMEERNNVTVYYNYSDGIEKLNPTEHEEIQRKTEQGAIKWVALKSMFFTVGLLPKQPFEAATLTSTPRQPEQTMLDGTVKRLEAYVQVPYRHGPDERTDLTLYLGPTEFAVLNAYPDKFSDQMDLGWLFIGWINKYVVLNVFKLVEGFTRNYGVVIFVLALFIKLIISPLTYRSYLSTARMQVVNSLPEVKELDEKYKDDPLALQNKKMAFYQSAGISPLAGCIPLILQLPILIAMFNFFPKSIELRQQPFLWAHDLSSFDSILNFGFSIPGIGDHLSGFAILMTISQLAYTYIAQQGQTFTGANAPLKYMGYIFPIIFFTVLNSYSAGLSYYYFVINILTIAQTYAIKAFVNEEKIKEKIHKTRSTKTAKGGGAPKTSGLTRWLEEQQKKQEAVLRERRQNQRKK